MKPRLVGRNPALPAELTLDTGALDPAEAAARIADVLALPAAAV